jgi:hypothetical protein
VIRQLLYNQSKTITGAAIMLGAMSFISRLMGFLRDRIFAHMFGAGDILEINLVEGNKVAMINFSKHSVLEIDQSQNLIVIDVKYLIIQ